MTLTITEQALSRVLYYLESSGIELTAENCLNALRMIERVLQQAPQNPMDLLMDELQAQFNLPEPPLPMPYPPLQRSSINYE
jgi:hypothetical protein